MKKWTLPLLAGKIYFYFFHERERLMTLHLTLSPVYKWCWLRGWSRSTSKLVLKWLFLFAKRTSCSPKVTNFECNVVCLIRATLLLVLRSIFMIELVHSCEKLQKRKRERRKERERKRKGEGIERQKKRKEKNSKELDIQGTDTVLLA